MSLDPELLFSALLSAGIKGIAGVPCSILNHLILEAEASDDVDYVAASVEGEAVQRGCRDVVGWRAGCGPDAEFRSRQCGESVGFALDPL